MSATLLYGSPAPGLVEAPAGATQTSPLIPGAVDLSEIADASLDAAVVLAPGGVLERGFVLAHALRTLKPGGALTAFAPKDRGGARLRATLEAFGCAVAETARRHHRFCHVQRPATLIGVEAAVAAGAPRLHPGLGVWTQPGVFSWDRLDPGTMALLTALPPLAGRGADLGCGLGVVAGRVLAASAVTHIAAIDLDRRAVDCARRNLDDPRAAVIWADGRTWGEPASLDFVVMNPPFHAGGAEDRDLGVAFIQSASRLLGKGASLWLVANRHLPYESPLSGGFARFEVRGEVGGFKVIVARR